LQRKSKIKKSRFGGLFYGKNELKFFKSQKMHSRAAAPLFLFPFKEIAPLFSVFVVFFVFKFSLTTKTQIELSNN